MRLLTVEPRGRGAVVPLPIATSSVLVGMTISLATQIVFTLSGLALLVFLTGHDGLTGPVIFAAVIGFFCLAGFYAVQRVGIFRIITKLIARIARGGAWAGLARRGEQLDEDVRACYARRGAMRWPAALCGLMGTWFAGAAEIYIAMWALGLRPSAADAYAIESLNEGVRSVMFLVPGALGFQEGGYLVVGRMLGFSGRRGRWRCR